MAGKKPNNEPTYSADNIQVLKGLEAVVTPAEEDSILVFNPTNCADLPIFFVIKVPLPFLPL